MKNLKAALGVVNLLLVLSFAIVVLRIWLS